MFQGHAKQTEHAMPKEHRWGRGMTNTKCEGVQVQTEWGQGLCPTMHLMRASTFWGLAHSLHACFHPQDSEEVAVSPSPSGDLVSLRCRPGLLPQPHKPPAPGLPGGPEPLPLPPPGDVVLLGAECRLALEALLGATAFCRLPLPQRVDSLQD